MEPVRTHCGSCQKSGFLEPILDLGKTPLADAFPDSPDAEEKWYPLGLVVCRNCWLVQNSYVVPDAELYNGDYGFYTGASPSSVAYFKEYADWAIKRFAPSIVVEIASNDGTLLKHFQDAGALTLGIEPSRSVAEASWAAGVPAVIEPFGRKVATDIVNTATEKPDLIIANNVIAHVSDLDDFVGGIADLLAPDGHVVIEFQYLGDLLLGNQFDHVYHEHRSFFSLTSLENVLARHGLTVTDYRRTPAQGGSMRVVAARGPRAGRGWLADEAELMTMSPYADLQRRAEVIRYNLYDLVREQKGAVAGYGATAKSTTLLNFCNLDPYDLRYVADLTPYKQGRFTPGTKIPIKAPDPDFDGTYLLLAWNYMSGVLRRERDFLDRGGRFIVPIPVPTVL